MKIRKDVVNILEILKEFLKVDEIRLINILRVEKKYCRGKNSCRDSWNIWLINVKNFSRGDFKGIVKVVD